MKRIIELEQHRNIYADMILALDNFIQEKEKYEALMKREEAERKQKEEEKKFILL